MLTGERGHHGPGNFVSADVYNAVGSPLPNFDEKVFRFLAERISRAIVCAIDDAQKHANEDHELLLYSGYALGIQRNRAIAAFYKSRAPLVLDPSKDSAGIQANLGTI